MICSSVLATKPEDWQHLTLPLELIQAEGEFGLGERTR